MNADKWVIRPIKNIAISPDTQWALLRANHMGSVGGSPISTPPLKLLAPKHNGAIPTSRSRFSSSRCALRLDLFALV